LQTHGLYRNALQQLLCTELDGNLSTPLNPPTRAKLDEYLSTLFRGKSKTTTLGDTFDKFMKNSESKELFGAKVKEIALSATIIPLSLFTNLFTKKFPKHEYLESTHELMQQVYIEMKTELIQFCLFPGDLSIYSLKCIRCRRSITSPGSIGETLYHAPIAMLNHWDMIVRKDATVDDIASITLDITSIPFVCTSLDSYYQAMNSYYQATKDKDYESFCFPNEGCRQGQLSFCEAVKVDMSKVNESHNNPKRRNSKHKDNVTHTMSLVRVLFEDFGVAISIHGNAKDINNTHPILPLILLNDGFKFEKGIVADKEYNQLEKECLKACESLCVFGYREYYKNLLCILVEFYYRISGKATPVPRPMMEIFDFFYPPLIKHMMG
jgi:hypothetical protein